MLSIKTNIDNLEINYIEQGSGKVVLILPGWGTTINTYMTMINSISTYAKVYCLDMPGFGSSQEPKESWNLDNYVDFVIKFIQKLDIQEINLIGHSNGGRIIIKLMNKKKLPFKVNNVILIGSAGIVHEKTLMQKIRIRTFKVCKKIAQLGSIKRIFPNLIVKVKSKFGSEDYKNASPIMRDSMVKLVNEDLKEFLPNIKVPTLLIWGENDTATPIADGELMEKLIPDSGLVRVKDCTHYVFLERALYVNNIIKTFLQGGK